MNNELTFHITGMDCAGCAQSIEKGVQKLEGVTSCQISFTSEKLVVSGDITDESIISRVRDLGFDVLAPSAPAPTMDKLTFGQFLQQRPSARWLLLAALLILPSLIFTEILGYHHPVLNLLSISAMLIAGWPVAHDAWRTLRINRRININVLMMIAAIGAVIIGAFTEAGMVMVLFACGELLEGYTAVRSRHAIRGLMSVAPEEATLLSGQSLPVAKLQVGDYILVKPGQRIPMDGRVSQGISAVDQAPITGESRLIEKQVGDSVFASSINGQGVLHIEVTHLAADNTISRLIKMVSEAQEKQAPAQRFIDKFAQYYTPAVVIVAVFVAVLPPLLFGAPFWNPDPVSQGWLYRALTLLVIACPCALVVSTPVTLVSAISRAAQQGILIKGGAYLELLSQVRVIALDKTGTITAGKPRVTHFQAINCQPENEPCSPCLDLLALASAVERQSEHPLAHAIVQASQQQGVYGRYTPATMATALVGQGIQGQVDNRPITIGSHAYFDQAIPHAMEHCQAINQAAAIGQTAMLIQADDSYAGYITVADTVRPQSARAVAQLKGMGIDEVVMLTGDDPRIAQKVADEVGVTAVRASLLPAAKRSAIIELQAEYGLVTVMVGDGINDTPALASADVGIAMGVAGTAQAMETADVALMRDDLTLLGHAIQLSRTAMNTVRANIIFSLLIKVVVFSLVLIGFGSMWLAVLADVGAAILVTLNGTRLLRYPFPAQES